MKDTISLSIHDPGLIKKLSDCRAGTTKVLTLTVKVEEHNESVSEMKMDSPVDSIMGERKGKQRHLRLSGEVKNIAYAAPKAKSPAVAAVMSGY